MAVESDEQWEQVKAWWADKGTPIVIAVVLAAGGVIGYRYWDSSTQAAGVAASVAYEELALATSVVLPEGEEGDRQRASAFRLGETIKSEYAGSTYALFAALHLAKLAAEASDFDRAVAELNFVLAQQPEQFLVGVATMRLARVLLAQGKPQEALTLLSGLAPTEAQVASVEEVRGDIFLAMGDLSQARAAYQLAKQSLGEGMEKPLLDMKLADLPAGPAAPPPPASAPPQAGQLFAPPTVPLEVKAPPPAATEASESSQGDNPAPATELEDNL